MEVKIKICTQCGIPYPATEKYYGKNKRNSDGFKNYCKNCQHEYMKMYHENNKEKELEYRKQYYLRIKDDDEYKTKRKKRNKEYYTENREKLLQQNKEYLLNNADKIKKQRKEYRTENKEKISKINKIYNDEHKVNKRNTKLKREYGITLDEYNSMLNKQNNKCLICGCELRKGVGGMSLDHCHITGNIRGILCSQCNTALGLVKENTETLQSMITYLEAHKSS